MWLLAVFALFWLVAQIPLATAHAAPTAVCSAPAGTGTYSVTLCITAPSNGATVSGVTTVSSSVNVSGATPGIQKLVYTLGTQYLLTDFDPTWTFNFPTSKFKDGTYTLAVSVYTNDTSTVQPLTSVSMSLTLSNGNTVTPTNTSTFAPTLGTTPASGQPFVLAAVGDGAGGETPAANVTGLIAGWKPNMFLYLGDVYEEGSKAEFYNWYAPSPYFGTLKSITNPTVGNHEYLMAPNPQVAWNPEGYVDYWGQPPTGTQWWYSFDVGGWHIVSLNTNCLDAGGCKIGSPQYNWLQSDLQAHANPCTLAFYHEPMFNIGEEGSAPITDTWALLANNHVPVVLNGHDHNYQRWVPLDANGNPSATGTTEFIAAAGGHSVQPFIMTDPRLAVGYDTLTNPVTYGALKLNLYTWKVDFTYTNTAGATLDSGTIVCGTAPSPPSTNSVLFLPMLRK